MFAEWLPVAKSAKCCASSWARNYTIYTVCGFCCPLENNELMREFSQETGAQFCRRKNSLKIQEGWELTVSGSPRYYLARIWSPEKCRIITLKCLFSFRRRMIYMRPGPGNWRPHQKTISQMTTFEARRKLSNHFYPHCKCIEWTEVLLSRKRVK